MFGLSPRLDFFSPTHRTNFPLSKSNAGADADLGDQWPDCGSLLDFLRCADGVIAFEDCASANGEGGRGDIALDFSFRPDQNRAAAEDVALHFPADDEAAAEDAVGDDIALFLDGDDAAGFDTAAGFVLLEGDVFEAQRFMAEAADDRHGPAGHLLGFTAVQTDDVDAIVIAL